MTTANQILEPPNGCVEIDGFILVIEEGKSWLTQDGDLTTEWGLRGVWETPAESETVRAFYNGKLR